MTSIPVSDASPSRPGPRPRTRSRARTRPRTRRTSRRRARRRSSAPPAGSTSKSSARRRIRAREGAATPTSRRARARAPSTRGESRQACDATNAPRWTRRARTGARACDDALERATPRQTHPLVQRDAITLRDANNRRTRTLTRRRSITGKPKPEIDARATVAREALSEYALSNRANASHRAQPRGRREVAKHAAPRARRTRRRPSPRTACRPVAARFRAATNSRGFTKRRRALDAPRHGSGKWHATSSSERAVAYASSTHSPSARATLTRVAEAARGDSSSAPARRPVWCASHPTKTWSAQRRRRARASRRPSRIRASSARRRPDRRARRTARRNRATSTTPRPTRAFVVATHRRRFPRRRVPRARVVASRASNATPCAPSELAQRAPLRLGQRARGGRGTSCATVGPARGRAIAARRDASPESSVAISSDAVA